MLNNEETIHEEKLQLNIVVLGKYPNSRLLNSSSVRSPVSLEGGGSPRTGIVRPLRRSALFPPHLYVTSIESLSKSSLIICRSPGVALGRGGESENCHCLFFGNTHR